jgi:hypothetical protein
VAWPRQWRRAHEGLCSPIDVWLVLLEPSHPEDEIEPRVEVDDIKLSQTLDVRKGQGEVDDEFAQNGRFTICKNQTNVLVRGLLRKSVNVKFVSRNCKATDIIVRCATVDENTQGSIETLDVRIKNQQGRLGAGNMTLKEVDVRRGDRSRGPATYWVWTFPAPSFATRAASAVARGPRSVTRQAARMCPVL